MILKCLFVNGQGRVKRVDFIFCISKMYLSIPVRITGIDRLLVRVTLKKKQTLRKFRTLVNVNNI